MNILKGLALAVAASTLLNAPSLAQDPKLNIIVFGAHPDDCELVAGGTGALWSQQGHRVKFVSVTNGDIGHHEMAGATLARRRAAEVQQCAQILGVTSQVLDIHDGELLPSLENRRTITRLIREWNADIVISHRPNDYHPDHRYTAQLVQDAAFMVIVPSFCPDVPALRKNPAFFYSEDHFKKPNPFQADVVVPIDSVLDKKVAAYRALESQFYEWNPWLFNYLDNVPADAAGRLAFARQRVLDRWGPTAERFRTKLAEQMGEEAAKNVKAAEAFELCEYGSQPSADAIRKLFPLPHE